MLAAFLKNIKPTLVVAFSIPFSVLVAALMMYFSGITLNIMSLAGLALGIGMLVDNSIVVIENIYRLRGRGIDPARASVQGARQVQGPILASTLTTVCVFLPMIFTTGYTRQLMLPFALDHHLRPGGLPAGLPDRGAHHELGDAAQDQGAFPPVL